MSRTRVDLKNSRVGEHVRYLSRTLGILNVESWAGNIYVDFYTVHLSNSLSMSELAQTTTELLVGQRNMSIAES